MNDYQQSVEALRLAALVYNHSHEAMMVLDADGRLLDVNPRYTTLTGFAKSEVLGQRLEVLRPAPEESEFHKSLWTALRERGHWAGEVWNRRKNGQVYPEWLEINVVRDAQGAVTRYVAQAADVSAKKSNEHHVWRLANYDKLTGLPNRSMFHERLEHEIRRAHRSARKLALLFLDLDGFKEVNDSLGHDAGDLLLQHVANRLAGCVRESDTIARLGGDEFIVILNEITDIAVVGNVAQKVVDALAAPFHLRGHSAHVSVSAGIALYPDDGANRDALLKYADQAMYAAKRAGRNRYCYYTSAMQEQVNRRARIAGELRLALSAGQIHVVYQPIVELHTGRIVQAEALLRWQHPRDGLVKPELFLPIAAEAGLAPALGNFVLRHALQTARQLNLVESDFGVSLNRASAEFEGREVAGAEKDWLELLAEAQRVGARLTVEVTEDLLREMRPAVQRQLQAMRAAGLRLAVDDFGAGYSSLVQITRLGSSLKLDAGLVGLLGRDGTQDGSEANQGLDAADEGLCEAIILLAHRLGLRVVANGVATETQCAVLRELGCDCAQGPLFAEPVAAEVLLGMLQQQRAGQALQLQREQAPQAGASIPSRRQSLRRS